MAKPSENLKELRECSAEQLIEERGLDTMTARDYAAVVVRGIQKRFRGGTVYIGVGKNELEVERNWLIWDKFNGTNHEELGRSFSGWNGLGSLTGRQIYNIIKDIGPKAIGKIQGNLFE